MRRYPRRRAIAALAALLVLAAACGGSKDAKPSLSPTPGEPTSTTRVQVGGVDVKAVGNVAPLTGLPITDSAVIKRPAIVVKIDNSDGKGCANTSRPQMGINQADVIFEIFVEGITRFAAVFHSQLPEIAGPVRSARSSDVDILPVLQKPIFAWSGNNGAVGAELRAVADHYVDVGYENREWSSYYFRENKLRCAPHNLFTKPNDLLDAADAGQPPVPIFGGFSTAPSPAGVASEGVKLTSGYEVVFKWNAAKRVWERTQNGLPHVDTDGVVMNTNNLVVIATTYKDSSTPGSLQAVSTGAGRALVYKSGKVHDVEWRRPDPTSPWAFFDSTGAPFALDPGRTWVHFALKGKAQDLTSADLAA